MISLIAGALLTTGGVTYWLMSEDKDNAELALPQQINSVEELYKLFEKGIPSFIPYGSNQGIVNAIRSELASDSTDFAYVQMGLIVLNHSGGTEFFIKNYHLDARDSALFLRNALILGAHNVAKVLIDKGGYKLSYSVYDFYSDDLIKELVSQANIRNSQSEWNNFNIMIAGDFDSFHYKMEVNEKIFVQNRNWKKCAELAIERLGCPVKPEAVKSSINGLKLMGKEKPLTDYISSKM